MKLLSNDEVKLLIQTLLLGGFCIGVGGWTLFEGGTFAKLGGVCGLLFGGWVIRDVLE